MHRVDVVVAGDGIAGSAAAIKLARSGVSVAVVGQPSSSAADLPETLAPAAVPLLRQLGLDVGLVDRSFRRVTSRLSRWGSGAMQHDDMLPRAGAALLLGKSRLRALLWGKLRELGCEQFDAEQVEAVDGLRDGTLLRLRPASGAGEAVLLGRVVIDATGRAAAVAHRLGVRRRIFDSLVSFWISGDAGDALQQATITATVRDGWVFYVGAEAGRAAVGFFTAGSHIGQKPTAASVIARARGIAEIAEIFASCPDWAGSSVITRNAATTMLERPCGPGWIACGDALQTVDPLTSSGNLIALKQGILAAEAAKAVLSGDKEPLRAYAMAAQREFREVLSYRAGYYGLVS